MARRVPRKKAPAPARSRPQHHAEQIAPAVDAAVKPFVVGVGASAGGLQALQAFFGAIPTPVNAAFVVVQHLSPDFKSFMVELLAKHTRMPVQRAEQGVEVKAGNLYLIPPKVTLTIADGRLQLAKSDPRRGLHLPIDQFFLSLAADQQHRAVAIVLSGTGSDGTAGIRAVKAAGGMVMVQTEESAQFDGMPRSAISTGLADYVLPPDKMPKCLVNYLNHPLLTARRELGGRRGAEVDTVLREIFALLRAQCGVDFSHYKAATIDRRIERRMSVCQIKGLADYARHLAQSAREVSLLFNELLINVTSFFRDRAAWEKLEEEVIVSLLKSIGPGETVRAWVAGCSTGEEAYSLAIMVAEQMDRLRMANPVKIFATDISKESLAVAARGFYSPSEVSGLTPERLQAFFVKESSGFRVATRLREMVVFANHNLLGDPPFTRLSLISCRNLLIYLQPALQQRVLTLFSFALRDEGVLFLGSSESIGDATDRFQPIATRANLYRNRRIGHPPPVLSNPTRVARATKEVSAAVQRANARITVGDPPTLEEIHRRIVSEFAPACLVVDNRDEVLHIVGSAGDYLKLAAGGFSRNVFKLTQHTIGNALRSAFIRAHQKGDRFTYEQVRFKRGRKEVAVRLHVRPFPDGQGKLTGTRLIFIEPIPLQPRPARPRGKNAEAESAHRIDALERDLSLTRESLQATVQDLETSNEEIQAANEELLAANEELQSTNEELQSVNEELHTVNVENQNRIEELTRLTNDINNLLATAAVGVLLIDEQLRIRRASRSALLLLDLTETDLGVPIETIARLLHAAELPSLALSVLQQGQTRELELEHAGTGRWLLLRCVPFRDELGRSQGVVLTLIDITERRATAATLSAQDAVTRSVLDAMEANVAILDRNGRILHVNSSWREFAARNGGNSSATEIGANYLEVCRQSLAGENGDARIVVEALQKILRGELNRFVHDYPCDSPTEKRWFRLHAVPLPSPEGGLAIAHLNITAQKQAEALLNRLPPVPR